MSFILVCKSVHFVLTSLSRTVKSSFKIALSDLILYLILTLPKAPFFLTTLIKGLVPFSSPMKTSNFSNSMTPFGLSFASITTSSVTSALLPIRGELLTVQSYINLRIF